MQFKLDPTQIKKLQEWASSYKCTINDEGAIGGKFTYTFTPNNIGTVEKVICACGQEIDITDYDW